MHAQKRIVAETLELAQEIGSRSGFVQQTVFLGLHQSRDASCFAGKNGKSGSQAMPEDAGNNKVGCIIGMPGDKTDVGGSESTRHNRSRCVTAERNGIGNAKIRCFFPEASLVGAVSEKNKTECRMRKKGTGHHVEYCIEILCRIEHPMENENDIVGMPAEFRTCGHAFFRRGKWMVESEIDGIVCHENTFRIDSETFCQKRGSGGRTGEKERGMPPRPMIQRAGNVPEDATEKTFRAILVKIEIDERDGRPLPEKQPCDRKGKGKRFINVDITDTYQERDKCDHRQEGNPQKRLDGLVAVVGSSYGNRQAHHSDKGSDFRRDNGMFTRMEPDAHQLETSGKASHHFGKCRRQYGIFGRTVAEPKCQFPFSGSCSFVESENCHGKQKGMERIMQGAGHDIGAEIAIPSGKSGSAG